jgi:hypothetical protein
MLMTPLMAAVRPLASLPGHFGAMRLEREFARHGARDADPARDGLYDQRKRQKQRAKRRRTHKLFQMMPCGQLTSLRRTRKHI